MRKRYTAKFPNQNIADEFNSYLKSISPKKIQDKILEKIDGLQENPRPKGMPKIKPPIFVYQHTAQHRIVVGDYRVLYDVDDKRKIVWILALRKRNERTYK